MNRFTSIVLSLDSRIKGKIKVSYEKNTSLIYYIACSEIAHILYHGSVLDTVSVLLNRKIKFNVLF